MHSIKKYKWLHIPFGLLGRAFSLAASMRYVSGDFDFVGAYYGNSILFSATMEDNFINFLV